MTTLAIRKASVIKIRGLPRRRVVTRRTLTLIMIRWTLAQVASLAIGLTGVIKDSGLPCAGRVTFAALTVKVRIGLIGGVA